MPRRRASVMPRFEASCMLRRHLNKPRHGMCQGKQNIGRARLVLPRSRCAHVSWPLNNHKRLSATDISAHASMKNVAKCDTWCELQNPVNHRVFERKLRPKPFGRGHVCLGVTHRVVPDHASLTGMRSSGAENGLPCRWRGWPKKKSPSTNARLVVVVKAFVSSRASLAAREALSKDPNVSSRDDASTATPGQAGLPAEFKHINKRRKRNLQGFP